MPENRYLEQVKILLSIIPLLNQYKEFAIKGGTAINFFLFNAPRLSVDIANKVAGRKHPMQRMDLLHLSQ